jgi:hypothetical protein
MKAKLPYLVVVMAAIGLLGAKAAKLADDLHEGKVLAVGTESLTVMGKTPGTDTHTFVVTAETKVTKNGKPGKLTDILVGDMVRVTASSAGAGGKLVAKEIVAAVPK